MKCSGLLLGAQGVRGTSRKVSRGAAPPAPVSTGESLLLIVFINWGLHQCHVLLFFLKKVSLL